jgi:hypothetical protein
LELADLVILAEDTGQVALGEEDGAGAVHAHQWLLLAKMRRIATDPDVPLSRQKPFSSSRRFTPQRLGQIWQDFSREMASLAHSSKVFWGNAVVASHRSQYIYVRIDD